MRLLKQTGFIFILLLILGAIGFISYNLTVSHALMRQDKLPAPLGSQQVSSHSLDAVSDTWVTAWQRGETFTKPNHIYYLDHAVPYKTTTPERLADELVQGEAALAYAGALPFKGGDAKNTTFIGSATVLFPRIEEPEYILLTDEEGTAFLYQVALRYLVDEYGNGVDDAVNYRYSFEGHGYTERVTFRTTAYADYHWIVVAEPAK